VKKRNASQKEEKGLQAKRRGDFIERLASSSKRREERRVPSEPRLQASRSTKTYAAYCTSGDSHMETVEEILKLKN